MLEIGTLVKRHTIGWTTDIDICSIGVIVGMYEYYNKKNKYIIFCKNQICYGWSEEFFEVID